MQPADECECGDILTAVGDFGQLVLEVTDVRLDVFTLPHFNAKEVIIVLVSHLARCVLSEKRFGYLLEVVKRMWR